MASRKEITDTILEIGKEYGIKNCDLTISKTNNETVEYDVFRGLGEVILTIPAPLSKAPTDVIEEVVRDVYEASMGSGQMPGRGPKASSWVLSEGFAEKNQKTFLGNMIANEKLEMGGEDYVNLRDSLDRLNKFGLLTDPDCVDFIKGMALVWMTDYYDYTTTGAFNAELRIVAIGRAFNDNTLPPFVIDCNLYNTILKAVRYRKVKKGMSDEAADLWFKDAITWYPGYEKSDEYLRKKHLARYFTVPF